jgi:ficolin
MEFSTKDKDNDITGVGHCAELHKGGWWYKHCMNSNLNGIYYQHGTPADGNSGIMWTPWKGSFESLKATEMKIRPRSFRETSSDD